MTTYCGKSKTTGHGSASVCGQPEYGPQSPIYQCSDCKVADLKAGLTNQQWQTIESAPKDGTWVLLTGGHSGIEADYCGPCVTAFWVGHEWDEGWVYAYWDGGWGSGYEDPTHWMPLPEPPK